MKANILKHYKQYIIILIISLIISIPLFSKNISFNGHDMGAHVSRVFSTISAINDGQVLIVPNYCNDFGYSWNLFYGPIFVYLSIILGFLLSNVLIGIKLVIFITIFFSAITMYNLIYEVKQEKTLALITAIIYITAPYRLTDIYTRFAVGEILLFMFIPMLFQGLYNIVEKDGNKKYLLIIGASGIILSHNISTFIAIILCVIYILFNIKKVFNAKVMKKLLISALFIVLLTAFFTIPMIESMFKGKYLAFSDGGMGFNLWYVQQHGTTLSELFLNKLYLGGSSNPIGSIGQNGEMCYSIGAFIIFALISTPFIIKKIPKINKNAYCYLLFIGILSALMSTMYFPWIILPKVFELIQFPWRMLMVTTVALSIISGINLYILIKNMKKISLYIVLIIICIFNIIYISPLLNTDKTYDHDEYNYMFYDKQEIYADTNWNIQTAGFEYLPKTTYENMEYVANREDCAISLSGSPIITQTVKSGTKLTFDIIIKSDNVVLELPYIYYPGYSVKLITDNDKINIKTKESENGFVEIIIPNNLDKEKSYNIQVKYTGTVLTKLAYLTSVITLLIIVFIVILNKLKGEKNEKNNNNRSMLQ